MKEEIFGIPIFSRLRIYNEQLENHNMQRKFASGSRQAPDPFDQFLEQEGFYRKHTARDSSCLFRTISEQMYDTQLHHLSVRQVCVDYMRKHKDIFQRSVDQNIDEYLDELSKPKTFGTILELRAMAYLYKRNVILFEAFNTGTWMVKESNFKNVFRVFFTPEKHFDSVYTNEFIEYAAFCQSICYEILYKRVFKLPDVTYAVEQMLHAGSFEHVNADIEYEGQYTKRILLDDGRAFEFDRPEDTSCILDNYNLCHFHNSNFTQFTNTLNEDTCLVENSDSENYRLTRTIDALLPEKHISCVRQLLNEGITPFPYKVAKALDPDIYRNIEFDAWSEIRKEQRFQNWYTGGSNLQAGVKCLVRLRNSQSDLYTCHIQEISQEKGRPCSVFVEDLGEKHTVPYDNLQPLPSDEAKPWPLPFRYQRHIEKYPGKYFFSHIKKPQSKANGKNKTYEIMYNCNVMKSASLFTAEEGLNEKDIMNRIKQYATLQHFQPPPLEYFAMPLNIERKNFENSKNNRRNSDINSRVSQASYTDGAGTQDASHEDGSDLEYLQTNENYSCGYGYSVEPYYSYAFDGSIINAAGAHGFMSNPPPYCYPCNLPFPSGGNNPISPNNIYAPPPPIHCTTQPSNGFYPPPYYPVVSSSTGIANIYTNTYVRRNTISTANTDRINYSAVKSEDESGSDLPKDIPTLRYFYNLGCEYFKKKYGGNVDNAIAPEKKEEKRDDNNKINIDLQKVKIESGSEVATTTTSQNQGKVDSNNNVPNTSNQGRDARRFHSRYFNSKKDRYNYRGGNRYVTSDKSSNNKMNYNRNSATNNTVSNDQAIQTSPVTAATPTENNEQHIQTPPVVNTHYPSATHNPFVPTYTTEGDHQGGGVFLPPPAIMSVPPFGIYGPPPSTHPTHGAPYTTFVGPAPHPQSISIPTTSFPYPHAATPGYYPSGAIEPPPSMVNSETSETGGGAGNHYTYFSPLYYATNSGPTQPQAYWYTSVPSSNVTVANTNSTNNSSSSNVSH